MWPAMEACTSEIRKALYGWRHQRVSLTLALFCWFLLKLALHAIFHEETCKKAFLIQHMCAPFYWCTPRSPADNDGDNLWKLPSMAILNTARRRWRKLMANKKAGKFCHKQYFWTVHFCFCLWNDYQPTGNYLIEILTKCLNSFLPEKNRLLHDFNAT